MIPMKPIHSHKFAWAVLILMISLMIRTTALAEQQTDKLTLVETRICESIRNYLPVNPAVVFSISLEEVFCFTAFDPVPEKSHIVHKWYKKDRPVFNAKLSLNPPKWSSFSSIKLRAPDKGPWRVDVVDAENRLIKTVRFSISD